MWDYKPIHSWKNNSFAYFLSVSCCFTNGSFITVGFCLGFFGKAIKT